MVDLNTTRYINDALNLQDSSVLIVTKDELKNFLRYDYIGVDNTYRDVYNNQILSEQDITTNTIFTNPINVELRKNKENIRIVVY